jgi:hypothetical protein
MKVSPEDVRTRLDAWRGVGACTASCFMASRALSRGAGTNGAVCAAPGGSRHHLYHRRQYSVIDRRRAAGRRACRRLCADLTCHAAGGSRDVDGKVRQRGARGGWLASLSLILLFSPRFSECNRMMASKFVLVFKDRWLSLPPARPPHRR